MKTKILTIAILYVLTLGALFTCPTKAQITRTTANVAMPSLSGEAATEFLKRDGSYEQLVEAVNKAGGNEAGAIQEFSQTKKLLASDGGGFENFARTVALSGDTAVISSKKPANGPNVHQGAVYVFERNFGGANAWGEVKKLIATDGEMNEGFGFSLAISGDTIVVGKEREMISGAQAAGGAYIYERHRGGPNNWGFVKRVAASDASAPNAFGVSVSISGNTIAVGATQDTIGGVVRGSVYTYERDSGGADNWGETKKIVPSDGAQGDQFGVVAFNGENLIVGAPGAVVGGNEQQGAAYIFNRDAGGANNWGQVRKLIAPDGTLNGAFGKSVGISGVTAIVCAGLFSPSAVYVFEREAGGLNNWGQVRKLTTDHAGQGASSVASIDGERIVIGEPQEVTGTSPFPGAAYLFERNHGGAGNWGRVKKLVATDTQAVALNFGNSVAVSGKTILAGALNESTFTGTQQRGAAYVFQTETQTWIQQSKPLPASCTVDDRFGWSVAVSGDTAIVGAPYADVGSNANQGAAYIFERDQGGAGAWGLVTVITNSFGEAEDLFGWSVALSGDKAIVGSPLDDTPTSVNTGSIHVFERNTGGVNAWAPILILFDGLFEQYLQLGTSVDIDGDVAIAGRPGDDVGAFPDQGSATVILFSGNTVVGGKLIFASDPAPNDNFGRGVAVSGNTVVVGAPYKTSFQGAGYVFDRNAGGSDNWGEVSKLAGDAAPSSFFGLKMAASGDTIVVGTLIGIAPHNAAYVFGRNNGGANTWGRVKKLTRPGSATNGLFGSAVAIEGEKIVVGDWSGGIGSAGPTGSIFVFEKNAGGVDNWGTTASLTSSDGRPYDGFGISVSLSGTTIISGASGDDIGGLVDSGSTYVFTDSGAGWIERAKKIPTLPTDCGTNDNYGYSVAIEGNTAVIGAPADDIGIKQDAGSVYILERDLGGPGQWGLVRVLNASDGATNAQFGFSVAIKNGVILVGAWQANVGDNNVQGAAYVFERNAGGPNLWGETKKLIAADGEAVGAFGVSVSLDNDTAVIGAHYADVGPNVNQGAAYVFSRNAGGANNWGEVKKLVASDGTAESFYGFPVSISGSTIVVGTPGADVGANPDQGAAYVYERNAGGTNNWGQIKKLVAPDGAANDFFSDYAATVNGDTIVVGSRLADIGGRADQGAAYIFYRDVGGAQNWGFVKKIVSADGSAGDLFGHAGVVSGDNIVIGAPFDDVGANQNQGSAYVFARNTGGPDNWGQVTRLSDANGVANDRFASAVAASGDDFLIGAYLATINQALTQGASGSSLLPPVVQGAAYVFSGTALAPTAAGVSVSGRVTTAGLVGLSGARVTLVAPDGEVRSAVTNAFGYFRLDDIPVGQTYIVDVSHKRYQFEPRTISVLDEIGDLNLTPQSGKSASVPEFKTIPGRLIKK